MHGTRSQVHGARLARRPRLRRVLPGAGHHESGHDERESSSESGGGRGELPRVGLRLRSPPKDAKGAPGDVDRRPCQRPWQPSPIFGDRTPALTQGSQPGRGSSGCRGAASATSPFQVLNAAWSVGGRYWAPPETKLERLKGFEPSTSTLARWRSTTELQPRRGAHNLHRGRGRISSSSAKASPGAYAPLPTARMQPRTCRDASRAASSRPIPSARRAARRVANLQPLPAGMRA